MKRIIVLGSVACSAFLLSGCLATGGITVTDIHQIRPATLADGSTTMIGYKAPQPQWQCAQIDRSSENWGGDKFKSIVDWHGPYKMLADHAVTYANQHNLKVNYIYLDIPVTVQMGAFVTDAFTNAYMNFYQCKYPPATSNRIL